MYLQAGGGGKGIRPNQQAHHHQQQSISTHTQQQQVSSAHLGQLQQSQQTHSHLPHAHQNSQQLHHQQQHQHQQATHQHTQTQQQPQLHLFYQLQPPPPLVHSGNGSGVPQMAGSPPSQTSNGSLGAVSSAHSVGSGSNTILTSNSGIGRAHYAANAGLLPPPSGNPQFMTTFIQPYQQSQPMMAAAAGTYGGGMGGPGNHTGHGGAQNLPPTQYQPPQSAQHPQQMSISQPALHYFPSSGTNNPGAPQMYSHHPSQQQLRAMMGPGPRPYLMQNIVPLPQMRSPLITGTHQQANNSAMPLLSNPTRSSTQASAYLAGPFCQPPLAMGGGPPLLTNATPMGQPLQTYSHLTGQPMNSAGSSSALQMPPNPISAENVRLRKHAIPIIDPITNENVLYPEASKSVKSEASSEKNDDINDKSKNTESTDDQRSPTASFATVQRDVEPPKPPSSEDKYVTVSIASAPTCSDEPRCDQSMQTEVAMTKISPRPQSPTNSSRSTHSAPKTPRDGADNIDRREPYEYTEQKADYVEFRPRNSSKSNVINSSQDRSWNDHDDRLRNEKPQPTQEKIIGQEFINTAELHRGFQRDEFNLPKSYAYAASRANSSEPLRSPIKQPFMYNQPHYPDYAKCPPPAPVRIAQRPKSSNVQNTFGVSSGVTTAAGATTSGRSFSSSHPRATKSTNSAPLITSAYTNPTNSQSNKAPILTPIVPPKYSSPAPSSEASSAQSTPTHQKPSKKGILAPPAPSVGLIVKPPKKLRQNKRGKDEKSQKKLRQGDETQRSSTSNSSSNNNYHYNNKNTPSTSSLSSNNNNTVASPNNLTDIHNANESSRSSLSSRSSKEALKESTKQQAKGANRSTSKGSIKSSKLEYKSDSPEDDTSNSLSSRPLSPSRASLEEIEAKYLRPDSEEASTEDLNFQFLNSSSSPFEDDDEVISRRQPQVAEVPFPTEDLEFGDFDKEESLTEIQSPPEKAAAKIETNATTFSPKLDLEKFAAAPEFLPASLSNATMTPSVAGSDQTITNTPRAPTPLRDCSPPRNPSAATPAADDQSKIENIIAELKKCDTGQINKQPFADTVDCGRLRGIIIMKPNANKNSEADASSTASPPTAPVAASSGATPKVKTGRIRYTVEELRNLAQAPESRKPPMVPCQKGDCIAQLFVSRQNQHHLPQGLQQHLQQYQHMNFNESMDFISSKRRVHQSKKHSDHQSNTNLAGHMGALGLSASHQRKMEIIRVHLSLKEEIKLSECENAWQPQPLRSQSTTRNNDEEEQMLKKVRGVLNKLTPDNFDVLLKTMTKVNVSSGEQMQQIMLLIFEKTISEPNFAPTYAKFCKMLFQEIKVKNRSIFTHSLIKRIQQEFETNVNNADAKKLKLQPLFDKMNASSDPKERAELQAEIEDQEYQFRRRAWGTVRFIGEMYKLQSLTNDRVLVCVESLLEHGCEEKLEYMCKLLTTVGHLLDAPGVENANSVGRMDKIFRKIHEYVQKPKGSHAKSQPKISSRVRFMMQDVLDLRLRAWDQPNAIQRPSAIGRIDEKTLASVNANHIDKSNRMTFGNPPSARGLRAEGSKTDNNYFGQKHGKPGYQAEQKVNIDVNKLKFSRGDEDMASTTKLGNSSNYLWRHQSGRAPPPTNLAGPSTSAAAAALSGAASNDNLAPSKRSSNPFQVLSSHERSSHSQFNTQQNFGTMFSVPPPAVDASFSSRDCQNLIERLIEELQDSRGSWQEEALNSCVGIKPNQQVDLLHYLLITYLHLARIKRVQRRACATIITFLMRAKAVDKQVFTKAYDKFANEFPDVLVDVPNGWSYVFEFLGPIIYDNLLQFSDIWLSQWNDDRYFTERFVKAMISYFTSEYGAGYMYDLWHKGFKLQKGELFSSDKTRFHAFMADNKFDFLYEATFKAPVGEVGRFARHSQDEQMERIQFLLNSAPDCSRAIDYVHTNVDINTNFIRDLTKFFCCDFATVMETTTNTTDNSSGNSNQGMIPAPQLNAELFRNKCTPMLRICTNSDEKLEAVCLDVVVQSMQELYDSPSKVSANIFTIFDLLYDAEVIPKESFEKWYRRRWHTSDHDSPSDWNDTGDDKQGACASGYRDHVGFSRKHFKRELQAYLKKLH